MTGNQIALSTEQIKELAEFVGFQVSSNVEVKDDTYIICYGEIPAFPAEGIPKHSGLIAYSENPESGVLAFSK